MRAAHATFIEKHAAAVELIRENLASLALEDRATIVRAAATALSGYQADIYFLDPPYTSPAEYRSALTLLGDRSDALVLAQHDKRFALAEQYGALHRTRVLTQGDNRISFYALDQRLIQTYD